MKNSRALLTAVGALPIAIVAYLAGMSTGTAQGAGLAVAPFDFKVDKPPILTANRNFSPFIIGGAKTNDYKNVVAIMLDGKVHCSGTMVASLTIVSAAHCIDGYEDAIRAHRMTYVIGSDVASPDFGPKPIVDARYPWPPDNIQYDANSFVHDVGVFYTSDPIPATAAPLHNLVPAWDDILNKQMLIFVGFGYNTPVDGDGIKRAAPWEVSSKDQWKVYFSHVAGKNTCSGDSGGPAFYRPQPADTPLLLAVTSVGDRNCTQGRDTRVDTHRDWIVAHSR
jgi:secreted trypsin-like serine protease